MRWLNLQGILCFAVAMAVSGTAFAADSYYVASTAGFGGVDISSTPSGISNAGIDRLLEVNSQDSLLNSYRDDATAVKASKVEPADVATPIANAADTAPSGMYLVAGVGAAFAMGLGLCCAGLMSGRKRTINTFTAGYVQLTK
jgi:hypothetical protein